MPFSWNQSGSVNFNEPTFMKFSDVIFLTSGRYSFDKLYMFNLCHDASWEGPCQGGQETIWFPWVSLFLVHKSCFLVKDYLFLYHQ